MKVKWIGDIDPGVQSTTMAGITFPKGKAVEVPDDHPSAHKFRRNQFFTVAGNVPEVAPEPELEVVPDAEPKPAE